ncbi:MAG: hypothetical protein GX640_20240 [Fibrobacter sp.]|nr:hypothetical protein [Fibrobacter sp.]
MKKKSVLSTRCSMSVLGAFAFTCALIFEWITGTACTSPQLIHDVQTAEPLADHKTSTTVSGGLSWAPSGIYMFGVPSVPNGDFSLLTRFNTDKNKEVQVPFNLSLQLGPLPVFDDPDFTTQVSTGVNWKHSRLKHSSQSDTTTARNQPLHSRDLYDAHVWGPVFGSIFTTNSVYGFFSNFSNQLHLGGKTPNSTRVFVLPYAGINYKFIHEYTKKGDIRFSGLLSGLNFYIINDSMVNNAPVSSRMEPYICGFTGAEYKRFLIQFTYGLGWQHLYGLKLFLGLTSSGKPK